MHAEADVSEDREAYPDMDARVAELFAEIPEPISEVLLCQIAARTPTGRYAGLIFALAGAWPGGPIPVLRGSPDAPRWLHRELLHTRWLQSDEFRVVKEEGWVE